MSLEIPDFESFIDREKGRPCLVAGNAPSLMNFPFAEFRGVKILTGSGPQILKGRARPDYWVNANHMFPVPQKHLRLINSFRDCVFIFSDSAAYWFQNVYDHDFLEKHIRVPWFAFDERHFNHQKCTPKKDCCRLVDLYPDRLTLQEFVERHFGVEPVYRGVGTAVLHSLSFAILMGCSPIYLQGIELPLYSKQYLYPRMFCCRENIYMGLRALKAQAQEWLTGKPKVSDFYHGIKDTLASFERLTNLCHNAGREIFNLSPTSNLNQIASLPYKDYKTICP